MGYTATTRKSCSYKKLQESSYVDELFQHFLGFTGYYWKFVLLSADITKLLNKQLRKDTKFHWSPQCQAAFKHLKQALCKEAILQYPSMEKPYTLFTDLSQYAHSGVLTQAVESFEDLRPVALTLGSFSEMQQR